MTKSVAVIGAGIAGITTAYYLAKEGYQVTVYEAERYPAMKTSFANGGQVSVSNSEVWTTWSNVFKGIKWMFTKDAPLLMRPRLDWAQWKWMAKFMYHTVMGAYEENTKTTIKLGLEADRLYKEIIAEERLEFDQSASGILHFYKNRTYFESAKTAQSIYQSNGAAWDILEPLQTQALDPALKDVKGIVGGAWTHHDWMGDIHKFCYQLSEVLKNKYGVVFNHEWKITHLEEVSFTMQ